MQAFTALSDPTRFRIIELLGQYGPLPAGAISNQFDMSAPAISQHLRILKNAQLVTVKVDAQRRIYALNPIGIQTVHTWASTMQSHVGASLTKKEIPMSDFTFTLTRSFDAPRDRVWASWTDEQKLAQWFGPKGCPISHSKLDLREGGTYHYAMEIPGGGKMWGRWTFLTIQKPNKLVFIVSFSDETGKQVTRNPWSATWPLEMYSEVHFSEKNGKTEVTILGKAQNATPEEIKTYDEGVESMTQGWTGTFEQLEAYLAK